MEKPSSVRKSSIHGSTAEESRGQQSPDSGAYLVLRHAGRWSDVFRLSPPAEAVIGRASSNQIVIRSERASRQHAKISWNGKHWQIEDLASRNGTYVNGQRLDGKYRLTDTDRIEVAGFAITFAARIEGGIGEPVVSTGSSAQATDEQITMEVDASNITDRRRQSSYLHGRTDAVASSSGGAPSRQRLKLALELARCDDNEHMVDQTHKSQSGQNSFYTAGIY
ncbi:MAG: FHA domain-containing protein, partial [Planctomycetota bacterium]